VFCDVAGQIDFHRLVDRSGCEMIRCLMLMHENDETGNLNKQLRRRSEYQDPFIVQYYQSPEEMHACRYPRLNIIHINKSCRLSIVRFLIQEATREARETRRFAFPILYDPSPFGANHWSSSSKLTSRKQRAMSSRSGLWERETRESDELSSYGL
jgi:hypothetical protein